MVDEGFDAGLGVVWDMGWRWRRLVLSAAKPNMRRKTHQPVLELDNGNYRIAINNYDSNILNSPSKDTLIIPT